jgi:large subunit ribosomal protein L23
LRPEDAMKIILYPYITEKTFDLIEKENKLVFIVDRNADKSKIKKAVEALYSVKVENVNVLNTVKGKKAYVKLAKESSAADLAAKLGLV